MIKLFPSLKRKPQRPDCDCEYCHWWKEDRKEIVAQFWSMFLCMAVLAYCLLK